MKPGKYDLLLVIDVQNDFCPGGALAVPDGDSVVPDINHMAGDFGHCVLTQDWHPAGHSSFASTHPGKAPFSTVIMPYGEQTLWPDHCIQGTQGAAFHPGLDLPRAQMIIRKGYNPEIDSYSAFFENDRKTPTGLAGYLAERGLKRIFCVGLATDFCVRFSAEDARKLGLETVVVLGACRGIDLGGSVAAGIAAMKAAGVMLVERV
ncbi:nicotinamidase [Labrys miyagiensis]|uniref:nicotinamidase n=1 Tax=Labrys miyagiensis TaxID=346912 RepID=A0ABQ6CD84_9HYPH|nr:bifunctional nicotinamidase/pyrazinamidase [Labrys miyagiensis]GLS18317.1 nicotinamidase [Labrys miyagiensis]